MRFEFATSQKILFGTGTIAEVPGVAKGLGKRAFVVYNKSALINSLIEQLKSENVNPLPYPVQGEPTVQSVTNALNAAKESSCDFVIGIGGGSTLDTGKAVSILLSNPGDLFNYLEVVGAGQPFENPSVPFVAIPTTAGTGSEVTRNAVISIPDRQLKVSLRSFGMLPRCAVVDPELTYSLPPDITATTGMDALTQLIEPFTCISPTPLTDAICRDGILRVSRSLPVAYEDGKNHAAREDMSLASMFGGLALANAKLGAVHGLASPIGGVVAAPHGAICARLLPIVTEANIAALRRITPAAQAIDRYREIAVILTSEASAEPEDVVPWITNHCSTLNIRPLGEFGLNEHLFPQIIIQAQKASSMKGNPVSLSDSELKGILEKAV